MTSQLPATCPITGAGSPDPGLHIQQRDRRADPLRLTRAPLLTMRRGADPRIPGPTGLPGIGVVHHLMRDPFNYLLENARTYGDVFRLPVPLFDFVFVSHPDLVREVYHDHGERFGVPDWPATLDRAFGTPFPFLDGDRYTERRSMITPMFGKRYLTGRADEFVSSLTAELAAWDALADSGKVVDLEHELAKILLPTFFRSMLSLELTEEQIEQYDKDLREILAGGASLVLSRRPPNFLPIPGAGNLLVSFRRMTSLVDRLIDERNNDTNKRDDLLQLLAEARLKDGTPLGRKSIVGDTVGVMVAGYDTVVAALAWMFSLLPNNPEAAEQLFDEVDALGGAAPTAADLPKLAWARQCFDEAQRLQGHPYFPRFAKVDQEIAGFHIPKGTALAGSATVLHRDPRWWAKPDVYDPHHFDADQVKARPQTAFIPFGTGPHQCVGMAMAYQNGLLLAALILQRYRIELQPGWTPKHKMTTSVTIKGGVPCRIRRR